MINLDYAANHPADPRVLDRFRETELRCWGNPNANHALGEEARNVLENAAQTVASLLEAQPHQVVFTSGASRANQLALHHAAATRGQKGGTILCTCLDHPSVTRYAAVLEQRGYRIRHLETGYDGLIDPARLDSELQDDVILLTLPAVDSELGSMQPLDQIKQVLARHPRCALHVDATQAIGHMPLSFQGIDYLTLSSHKFGGPNGNGVLLARNPSPSPANAETDEATLFEGTPSAALAASTALALQLALEHADERNARIQASRSKLLRILKAYPLVEINAARCHAPHILNVSVRGIRGTRFQRELSSQGVCVSVKSACAESGEPSRAVLALTGSRARALSSWRISLSHLTTNQELDAFQTIFDGVYERLAASR